MLVIADLKGMFWASRNSRKSGKLITAKDWKPNAKGLEYLVQQTEAGKFRGVIDRVYDLADIVEAHRYVDTGRKKGNVVLRIAPEPSP